MKTSIYLFFVFFIVFSSCKKSDELTVNLKTSGNLSVKVSSNAGVLPSVKVKLYDYYSSSSSNNYLVDIMTNSSGEVDFGELNQGTYYIVVDTPKVNNIKYKPVKMCQVISGSSKSVEINIEDYSATFTMTVFDYYDEPKPIIGLNVVLVPSEAYSYNLTLAQIIQKAEFKQVTNSLGKVSFKVPSSRGFYGYVYKTGSTTFDDFSSFNLDKDQVYNTTRYFSGTNLYY